ncbi:MAG: SDR family oxidoreductase [Pseudomonadota bacterium]
MADYPTTPSFRLDGKRALVTGASRGIGLGGAIALAEAGADVTLAARTGDDIEAAAAHLTERGLKASALAMDVTDTERTADAIAAHGPFDILFNNAGIARHAPFTDATGDDFDAVVDVNVKAAYFAAQAVVRGLIAAERPGVIIHTSSQMGHVGGVDRTVYCGTKHAIEGITKAMAIECGPHGIRVNAIAPTFIRTPLTQSTFENPERRAWVESKIKLGRVGEIEDIMGAVVFLASDASALITGTSLLIDGGWVAD